MPKYAVIILAMLIALTGCANTSAGGESSLSSSAIAEPPSKEDISGVIAAAELSIADATDELLSGYASYDEISVETEYARRAVITTNVPAKEFKLFHVAVNEDGYYFENGIIYSTDALLPEKPFVVSAEYQPGVAPNKAVSFLDENGITKYFLIGESGEDGSLGFHRFTPSA